MLKQMGKKILTILRSKFCLSKPVIESQSKLLAAMATTTYFYLRRFSESRSSSGSTPSGRPSVRPKHLRVPSLCNL